MRILHILDAAGVACIYSKFLQTKGHESKVIWNKDVGDKYGIYDYYKDYMINVPYVEFTDRCPWIYRHTIQITQEFPQKEDYFALSWDGYSRTK